MGALYEMLISVVAELRIYTRLVVVVVHMS